MKFVAKTLYGLEKVLAEELISLGATDVEEVNRAVLFKGDKALLYKVNYCARSVLSVLMPVADFRIRSKEDLYAGGAKIKWDQYLGSDDTFSIVPVINSPYFTHTGYPGLVMKDTIADYFRNKSGRRPSVDSGDPGILINLHISNDRVTVSIDSSVIPLFKRGYRQEQAAAPLNEVLAAGMLLLSGWNATSPLLDPMCGSGTIPIEAGLIACKIPPGKTRKNFGFQKWKDFDEQVFDSVKSEADSQIVSSPVKISGSDISDVAVSQARSNISRAGLSDTISLEVADFASLKTGSGDEFVFLNPPYGERLQPGDTDALYATIGTTLKHNFSGVTAMLITSNRESLKKIGLKPKQKYTLFNGALECTLLKYEMYQGTRKTEKI